MDLNKNVKYIKGVGPNRVILLNKLGIFTLKDLINYYPRTYEDRSKPKKIIECTDGEETLIEGIVCNNITDVRINGKTMQKAIVRDETGAITITWFNQSYLKKIIKQGNRYQFYGKISNAFGKINMTSPVFDEVGKNNNTGKIVPIYPLTYQLSQNTLRKIIEAGLKEVDGELTETLPKYLIKEYKLEEINKAIRQVHFPKDFKEFEKARYRLVFEELLSVQLELLELKNNYNLEEKGIKFSQNAQMSEVINKLPFKLTKAQIRVLEEIDNNMESEKTMNRLLQGDVGSRKDSCCNVCSI